MRLTRLRTGRLLVTLLAAFAALGAQAACASSPTAPAAAPRTAAATLAVFGDVNNSGNDTPAPVFGFVCAGIKASGARVAVSTGDALNDVADTSISTSVDRWKAYLAVETPKLGNFMPIWRTAGDNDRLDLTARLKAWNQVFPRYPTTADASRRWYAKSLLGVHVIFLNTAYAGHVGFVGYVSEASAANSAEAKWLVKDLKAATAGTARKTIVVVMHYPLTQGKSTKPYAGSRRTEATALKALFAKYGVDMVLAGDTHVYRRTMVTTVKSGVTHRVPYIQIPPAASGPRSFGTDPIPALASSEAGWAPGSDSRGFLLLKYASATHKLTLSVRRVDAGSGAVSSAETEKANGNALGGTFSDIPKGSRVR
jgi:hypothetical protein